MSSTLGLPLGLIWRDQAIDNPPVPPPPLVTCGAYELNGSGASGVYRVSLNAGTSVGVVRLVFNTGTYFLPSDSPVGQGNPRSVNPVGDRLKWSHSTIGSNQSTGSSIGANFWYNDNSSGTDVAKVGVDTFNTLTSSNLEQVTMEGMIGAERSAQAGIAYGNKIDWVTMAEGSVIPTGVSATIGASANPQSGVQLTGYTLNQNSTTGVFENKPILDWDSTANSGAGAFVATGATTNIGPYGGWPQRNSSFDRVTLTPQLANSTTHSNQPTLWPDQGDMINLSAVAVADGEFNSSNTTTGTVGAYNSSLNEHQFYPGFHASRNTMYCIPVVPNHLGTQGKIDLEIEAPLSATWWGIVASCPIDMGHSNNVNYQLQASSVQSNWNATCNKATSQTIYHMPVDVHGKNNPASWARDENGIPTHDRAYSPVNGVTVGAGFSNSANGVNYGHVAVAPTGDSRELWENLVSLSYITQNGRSAFKNLGTTAAISGGNTVRHWHQYQVVRHWYGMADVSYLTVLSFPAANQIQYTNVGAVTTSIHPGGVGDVQVGDMLSTGTNEALGNNGADGIITIIAHDAVNKIITVSANHTGTTAANLTGFATAYPNGNPIILTRMGDVQTKPYFDHTVSKDKSLVLADINGQPPGDIGIRDFVFSDRYGEHKLADGFYKVVDRNNVNNGNGGKKRIKVKDGIVIKCRKCFGRIA